MLFNEILKLKFDQDLCATCDTYELNPWVRCAFGNVSQYNCWKNIPWTLKLLFCINLMLKKALFKGPKICNINSSDLGADLFPYPKKTYWHDWANFITINILWHHYCHICICIRVGHRFLFINIYAFQFMHIYERISKWNRILYCGHADMQISQ